MSMFAGGSDDQYSRAFNGPNDPRDENDQVPADKKATTNAATTHDATTKGATTKGATTSNEAGLFATRPTASHSTGSSNSISEKLTPSDLKLDLNSDEMDDLDENRRGIVSIRQRKLLTRRMRKHYLSLIYTGLILLALVYSFLGMNQAGDPPILGVIALFVIAALALWVNVRRARECKHVLTDGSVIAVVGSVIMSTSRAALTLDVAGTKVVLRPLTKKIYKCAVGEQVVAYVPYLTNLALSVEPVGRQQ